MTFIYGVSKGMYLTEIRAEGADWTESSGGLLRTR